MNWTDPGNCKHGRRNSLAAIGSILAVPNPRKVAVPRDGQTVPGRFSIGLLPLNALGRFE